MAINLTPSTMFIQKLRISYRVCASDLVVKFSVKKIIIRIKYAERMLAEKGPGCWPIVRFAGSPISHC